MIQFNLLPDVKIEYVKAQRTKRLVVGSAVIATASSFVICFLLFVVVQGIQKKSIGDLNDDIKTYTAELKETPDLNKVLTIQNQLGSLNDLHDKKVVTSRVFNFMQQTTPADVTISEHSLDFAASTMTVTGDAPSLDKVNTFVDSLKFATIADTDADTKPFSDVVLSQFARSEKSSSYTISLTFDPLLFGNDQAVNLIVPKTITTRSVVEQPTDIFKKTQTSNPQGN